ncbi:MAG: glycosyltransferase family 39 protein [Candidatus Omnitrophica bacterium]|nr:glycosyltransferase family 39 protein [Candidatus Omnitrophota bacterium]
MKKIAKWEKHVFILILLSVLFFIIGNTGLSLTNPDEVFYMDSAKEMVKHNSWLTPYIFGQPQFEKPIFTYWLIRMGFLMFGITAFAGRIFPAIFALLGVISLYILGLAGFGERKKAFYSALILGSSVLYLGLARTVFTDLIFSMFILFALTAFYWGYAKSKKNLGVTLFFVFSALAVLTKGPLGILIPGLVALMFLIWRKELKFIFCPAAFWGLVFFAVIAVPWYAYMLKNYGNGFIREFWVNDHLRRVFVAEHPHNDRWYFYPFSMLGCMFPWTFYVAAGLWSIFKRLKKKLSAFSVFLVCWLGVVFAIFQPAHSKLVSYIFPLFPALALIAGDFFVEKVLSRKTGFGRVLGWVTALILLIIPVAVRAAAAKYPLYFSSGRVVQILAFLGWVISFGALVFVFLRKPKPAFFIQAALLPAILIAIPLTNIDPYVSSRKVSEYLSQQPINQSVILCSKAFVRGVHFYTGSRAAVFDSGSDNFFSPHPIPFINTDKKLRVFLASQPITYCVLKKSALDDLQRLAGDNYQIDVLLLVGNEYVLKVEERVLRK